MLIGISALHIRPGKCGSHEPYLVNLVDSLSGIDKINEYFVFVNLENSFLFNSLGSNFHLVLCSNVTQKVIFRIIYEQTILPIKILLKKIKVVHFPGNSIPIFHPFLTVVTVHTDSIRARSSMGLFQRIFYDIFLRINKTATKIIVPTSVYAQQLSEFFSYSPKKIIPIHHGFNTAFHEKSLDEKRYYKNKWGIEDRAILSVTNTLPHKNLTNLFIALDHLSVEEGIEPQLVLVGYIDHDVLNKYIGESTRFPEKMKTRIKVIQFINNIDLTEIYNASSYFVFPSKEECFGMPIVEAMACGTPAVTSNVASLPEVMGEIGTMCDPFDTFGFAQKIHALINDEEYRQRVIFQGLTQSTKFNWENTAKKTIDVYNLVNRK